jgi:hypothetical protein
MIHYHAKFHVFKYSTSLNSTEDSMYIGGGLLQVTACQKVRMKYCGVE